MALVFEVKVTPSAGRGEWKLDKSDILKCYVKSPAEQGKANAELIKELSKIIGVPQSMITILSGSQTRKKRIKIDVDISYDRLLELLGVERQISMFDK